MDAQMAYVVTDEEGVDVIFSTPLRLDTTYSVSGECVWRGILVRGLATTVVQESIVDAETTQVYTALLQPEDEEKMPQLIDVPEQRPLSPDKPER
jgi:hypothetical protein